MRSRLNADRSMPFEKVPLTDACGASEIETTRGFASTIRHLFENDRRSDHMKDLNSLEEG
uniref:Uncharacterized protein n=1 Tax=Romanomermis culicivorax TaxID=13658 RepID=A0A915IWJ5_ROMCU